MEILINRIDPDGRAWYTRYVDEQGKTLLNTDDGRDDVVVVPSDRLDEFKENVEASSKPGQNGRINSRGWNDYWRGEFGIAISEDLLRQIGYFGLSSEKSREASIEYLFGSRSYQSFVWEEVKGQWGNPVLVTTGLLAGAHGTVGMLSASAKIQFGANTNQVSHTFRHIEQVGLSRSAVEAAVKADLGNVANSLSTGKLHIGTVNVNGVNVTYNAYKLQNGTINVGRITTPN